MLNVRPTLGIPEDIVGGLQSGKYERVGGVVREVGSKQIVAWLRDVTPDALNTVSAGLQVTSFLGVLNLAVSVIGFVLVLNRLNKLEVRFKELQALATSTARKIDLMMDGQAYSALQLARLAMQSELPQNRRDFALSALNGLLGIQVQVNGFLSDVISEKRYTEAVVLYQYLCLIYVAEVLCYLELGENRTARDQTKQHYQTLVALSKNLVGGSLNKMQYPILSPAVLEVISWDRILDLHRWVKPEICTEDLLIVLLPKANAHEVEREHRKLEDETSRRLRFPTKRWPAEEQRDEQIQQLASLEALVEDTQRFGAYEVEIEAMMDYGKSFAEWRDFAHGIEALSAEGVLCLRVIAAH